jgi:hypothetical protein
MRTFVLILSLTCLTCLISQTICADSKPKPVSFKEVSSKVSDAFCQKMDRCSQEKIPVKKCVSEMNDLFLQNYDALPKDKKVEVEATQLELCTKSIQDSSCQELKAAQKLNGCEFIGQLTSS